MWCGIVFDRWKSVEDWGKETKDGKPWGIECIICSLFERTNDPVVEVTGQKNHESKGD